MSQRAPTAGALTLARIRRVRELYRPSDGPPSPFTSGCPWCGLDGALYRPCAGGRSWTVRCRCCGARTFGQNPRQFFAPSTVVDRIGQGGDEARIRFMQRLDQLGHRALQRLPWETGVVGGRTVLQLPQGQACLCCGEPEALVVRRDRHGRPYGSCSACTGRTFWRHGGGLLAALGWSAWLTQPGHDAAWWEAFQLGKQQWSRWVAPLQPESTSKEQQAGRGAGQETA